MRFPLFLEKYVVEESILIGSVSHFIFLSLFLGLLILKGQFQTQQLNSASGVENTLLAEVDEVVTEITLEDIGDEVLKIFFDLRGATNDYTVKSSMHIGTGEEILKHRDTVLEKFEELKTAMKKHLKELE